MKDLINGDVSNVFLNFDEFAENVVVHTSAGDRNLCGIVEVDEPGRDINGFLPTVYTGRIRIDNNHRAAFLTETNPTLTVTTRGYTWDVTDIGEDDFGMRNVGIRREIPAHSNAIDLAGTQHRYVT